MVWLTIHFSIFWIAWCSLQRCCAIFFHRWQLSTGWAFFISALRIPSNIQTFSCTQAVFFFFFKIDKLTFWTDGAYISRKFLHSILSYRQHKPIHIYKKKSFHSFIQATQTSALLQKSLHFILSFFIRTGNTNQCLFSKKKKLFTDCIPKWKQGQHSWVQVQFWDK